MFRHLLSVTLGSALAILNIGPAAADTKAISRRAQVSRTAHVNGTELHYLSAGSGPITVVLIHGFAESSYEWREVMPRLSETYRVIAVDLRGVGGSAPTRAGYDKANMARDVRELVRSLGLHNVYVFGHDIGGMVAYAFARNFPGELAGFGVFDVALPGIGPWEMAKSAPSDWHFGFHQTPGLPEALVEDRQDIYFHSFYRRLGATSAVITPADEALYVNAYRSPGQLKAGFEWYRAFPQDEAFNKAHAEPLTTPMLLLGPDGPSGPFLQLMADGLRQVGVANVRTVVIKKGGHWIAEEQPEAVEEAIRTFVSETQRRLDGGN